MYALLALTLSLVAPASPPMGWNGYNHYGPGMTASQIEAGAHALVTSGMAAHGYNYVLIDGGWASRSRDADGNLVANRKLYPQGISPVVSYVHRLGLKIGIYLDAGNANCAKTMAGSWNHYKTDADWVAAHGFDMVKLDFCYMPKAQTPLTAADVQSDATRVAQDLAATGRPILLDVNDANGAHGNVQTWGRSIGAGMGRVTQDIRDTWHSMLLHVQDALPLTAFNGPGYWNDLDGLEVGNGGMTEPEGRAQMSLYAVLGAPLVAGNDLRSMDAYTKATLTNPAVLAVDASPLPAQVIQQSGMTYVIARPMPDGSVAVVLFNAGTRAATVSTTAQALGLPAAASYQVTNLWTDKSSTSGGAVSATVATRSVRMYEVSLAGP